MPFSWLTERQIMNPDALRLEWLFPVAGDDGQRAHIWPRTILRSIDGVPRMGRDFRLLGVEVQRDETGWRVKSQADGAPIDDQSALTALSRRFGGMNGLDHPNEIVAYMMPHLVFPATTGRRATGDAAEPAQLSDMEQRLADWWRSQVLQGED